MTETRRWPHPAPRPGASRGLGPPTELLTEPTESRPARDGTDTEGPPGPRHLEQDRPNIRVHLPEGLLLQAALGGQGAPPPPPARLKPRCRPAHRRLQGFLPAPRPGLPSGSFSSFPVCHQLCSFYTQRCRDLRKAIVRGLRRSSWAVLHRAWGRNAAGGIGDI